MAIIKCKKITNEKYISEFAPFKNGEEFQQFTRNLGRKIYNKSDLLNKYLACTENLSAFIKTKKIKEESIIYINKFEAPYKFNIGEHIMGYKILNVEWINNTLIYYIDKIIKETKNNVNADFLNNAIKELRKQ